MTRLSLDNGGTNKKGPPIWWAFFWLFSNISFHKMII